MPSISSCSSDPKTLLHLLAFGLSSALVIACNGDGSSTEGSASESDDTGGTSPTTTMPTTTMPTSTTEGTTTATSTTGMTDTATTSETGGETDTGGNVPPCPHTEVAGMPSVGLEKIADGFVAPVLALGHPTQPDRLFVVQQTGEIKILEPGENMAPADDFLALAVNNGPNEAGLLGFAFHPDFPDDPRVYVNYNPAGSPLRTRIEEYQLDGSDPDVVDTGTSRILLEINQPQVNHNGGMIGFGPDGYLYIGMGDGGGSCDSAAGSSRDKQDLLSKLLRIDVEPGGGRQYSIPADNPFVGDASFAPEIYAWGLRNPWRFSWDVETGTLYLADVGQDAWEEVDIITAGHDYGWDIMEGAHCSQDLPKSNCGGPVCDDGAGPNEVNSDGITMPIFDYENSPQMAPPASSRCSVTGGAVYRSCEVPAWDGVYFFGDYCSRELFALVWNGTSTMSLGTQLVATGGIMGMGWNAWGDVFFTTLDNQFSGAGSVWRVAPQ